jgi:hypothetical protein
MTTGTNADTSNSPRRPPLSDLARQLATDGLALARAEIVLARVRLTPEITRATIALGLLAGAGILAFLGAIALVVGLVIALAVRLGPALAGLAVGGPAIAIAGLLGWVGLRRLVALIKPLLDKLP